MLKPIFLMSVLVGLSAFAGVSDYLVFDYAERVNNKNVDVVVKARVNNYYAFSGVGLAYSVVRSTATNDPSCSNRKAGTRYYELDGGIPEAVHDRGIYRNHILQLKRNSIWLLDVNVEECLSGNVATNRISLIIKPTRAFKPSEYPDRIYSHYPTNTITFKLRKVPEGEVEKSFGDYSCYIKGDFYQEGAGYVEGLSGQIYGHEFGDLIDVKNRHFFSYRPSCVDDSEMFLGAIFDMNYERTFHEKRPNDCYVVVDLDIGQEEAKRKIEKRARELRKKYGKGAIEGVTH